MTTATIGARARDLTDTVARARDRTVIGARARDLTDLPTIAGALLAGALLIVAAGFAQSAMAHGAAHDQRHALAFPCH